MTEVIGLSEAAEDLEEIGLIQVRMQADLAIIEEEDSLVRMEADLVAEEKKEEAHLVEILIEENQKNQVEEAYLVLEDIAEVKDEREEADLTDDFRKIFSNRDFVFIKN